MNLVAFSTHDHQQCVRHALAHAQKICKGQNLRFTPLRRRVLEMLLQAHHAVPAYDVLANLNAEGLGSQPPTAYRALDFLVANGFAHKIQKLNAYIACHHPELPHSPLFLICRQCQSIAEKVIGTSEAIALKKSNEGFVAEETVFEMQGLCPECAAEK